jgi:hypothetical protein
MSIISPGKITLMALRPLKARPDISLDIFQHMTQVHRAVGIGQGTGNQYSSFLFAHSRVYAAGFRTFISKRNYGTLINQAVASGG